MFRRNSGCSAEQKTLGIPFRTIPQKRKMLGILCHETKLEANSRNFVLNHSAEQKTLGIAFQTVPQRSKMLEFRSEACLEQKHAVYSVCKSRIFFIKLTFFMPFSSVPSLGIDSSVKLGMPRNEHFLPWNFFRMQFRCQPYSSLIIFRTLLESSP